MRLRSLIEKRGAARHYFSRYARLWLIGVLLFSVALPIAAHAVTPLSQGYSTEGPLAQGSIVGLQNNTSDSVIAASSATAESILGVVINDGTSLLSLSSGQGDQVQVATSGTVQVLVSDMNGKISQGDHITASPIKGVGMKATNNAKVVGIAQGEPTHSEGSEQTYTDQDGNERTVLIGQVPTLINVAFYFKQPDQTIIPSALQNVANALAGKKVEPLPIIISAVIFLITLIVVSSIIYSMIRSSIISVGRNPMSQSAVYRDVIQLSALVLGILAVAIISIYMVLTRL